MVALMVATMALGGMPSIQEFGVSPKNPPEKNLRALQKAVDWASARGAALYVEPTDQPYRVASGLILKINTSLVGAHGPVGRGTKHPTKPIPVGSVFQIEDTAKPFITVETGTRIQGIQFWYSKQTLTDPSKVIEYPPTIQVSKSTWVNGVTLRDLTFYGETMAMDFAADKVSPCEQILFENCYGYPLSGEFIRIDYCYDIPRILHCHVNPANRRAFQGDMSKTLIDWVIARGNYAYRIEHTDNAQLMDLFTFGSYGGIMLGPATYGQLTNFNFDCVTIGVRKRGDSVFNRNWMVGQGSIIANIGKSLDEVHPFLVDGDGFLAISNVEAFSGFTPVLTSIGQSQDYMRIEGNGRITVSISGSRMRNYAADLPITLANPNATVRLTSCFDKAEKVYEAILGKQD